MAVRSKLTLDEFLGMQETKPYCEYVRGEAIQKPMPTYPHSVATRVLIVLLAQFLDRTGLGEILPEFRCIFGPPGGQRAYVPDLAYVRRELLPVERFLHAPPDLAIEVLSPDQDMTRFLDKIQFYLLHGVRMIWVIDPVAATVAVMVPGEEAGVLSAGDTLNGGDVLPGFSVPVEQLFRRA
jgi:Uma2 family endonuclease